MSATALVSAASNQIQGQSNQHVSTQTRTPSSSTNAVAPVSRQPSTSQHSQSQASQPSTPQQATQVAPVVTTPGKWEHPQINEIIRRQHRNNFDARNAQQVLYCSIGVVALTVLPRLVFTSISQMLSVDLTAFATFPTYAVQLLLLLNIITNILPLLRKKDTMEDIPLTPQQRQLLDLPPMSRPATPQEQAAWVTPPRYSRNTTPSSMDSLLVNARGTPLSARASPRESIMSSTPPQSSNYMGKRAGGSPYSGSPLARASPDTMFARRRDSSGTPRGSPLASESEVFGTPLGKSSRASIGLNSKWLYEKGKASPTAPALVGSGWGSGSVFM